MMTPRPSDLCHRAATRASAGTLPRGTCPCSAGTPPGSACDSGSKVTAKSVCIVGGAAATTWAGIRGVQRLHLSHGPKTMQGQRHSSMNEPWHLRHASF